MNGTYLVIVARNVGGDELLEVVFSQCALDAILQRVIVGDDIPDICGRMEGLSRARRDAMGVRTIEDVVDFAGRRLEEEVAGGLDSFLCVHGMSDTKAANVEEGDEGRRQPR